MQQDNLKEIRVSEIILPPLVNEFFDLALISCLSHGSPTEMTMNLSRAFLSPESELVGPFSHAQRLHSRTGKS
jgi:hypothetical protein